MPMIIVTGADGRPVGTRWVSKHSREAQPSDRSKRKNEARTISLALTRAGQTAVRVKRPVIYRNTPARWRSAAAPMKEAA